MNHTGQTVKESVVTISSHFMGTQSGQHVSISALMCLSLSWIGRIGLPVTGNGTHQPTMTTQHTARSFSQHICISGMIPRTFRLPFMNLMEIIRTSRTSHQQLVSNSFSRNMLSTAMAAEVMTTILITMVWLGTLCTIAMRWEEVPWCGISILTGQHGARWMLRKWVTPRLTGKAFLRQHPHHLHRHPLRHQQLQHQFRHQLRHQLLHQLRHQLQLAQEDHWMCAWILAL